MSELSRYAIVIALMSFEDGSGDKKRPVMVVKFNDETLMVLKITSQFEHKSEMIQKQYFEIIDWFKAGLKKPSWIDTVRYYEIDNKYEFTVLGHLTERDIERFKVFIRECLSS